MTSNKLHVALGFGNEVRITRGRSFLQKTKRNHKTPTQFLLIDYRPGRRNALQRNQYGAPGNERANFQRDTSVRVFAEVARVHSFGNRVDFTVIHSAWYLLCGNSKQSPNTWESCSTVIMRPKRRMWYNVWRRTNCSSLRELIARKMR